MFNVQVKHGWPVLLNAGQESHQQSHLEMSLSFLTLSRSTLVLKGGWAQAVTDCQEGRGEEVAHGYGTRSLDIHFQAL